jgi:hypothetical protein
VKLQLPSSAEKTISPDDDDRDCAGKMEGIIPGGIMATGLQKENDLDESS